MIRREIAIESVQTLMERLLEKAGVGVEDARVLANIFLEADLRGINVQGLHHFIFSFWDWLRTGRVDPKGKPHVIREMEGGALVDGNRGPGPLAGLFASDLAVAKSKKSGSAVIGIINSTDIFMIGYYAERVARAGHVGLVFSDAISAVHPFGGCDSLLGTNPIGVAIPRTGKDPFMLDVATSAWLKSAIRWAARDGEEIPDGVAIDHDGKPTRNANEALNGAVSPMAGHKGFGLALMVALLSGPLVGADVGAGLDGWRPKRTGRPGSKGHLFMAINPAMFGSADAFRERVDSYLQEIKNSRKAPGFSEIRIPGERTFQTRERNLARGTVSIDTAVWSDALTAAREVGVSIRD